MSEAAAATMIASSISSIEQGVLRYRGVSIGELAAYATYEEVVWLLWHGSLPGDADREQLFSDLAAGATVPESVWGVMRSLPSDSPAVARMQVALPLLALRVPELAEASELPGPRKAARLVGAFITIAANLQNSTPKVIAGGWPGAASVFLRGARQDEPSAEALRAMEQVLILHAEHELNASTFTARVTASTRADLVSAVLAALSALRGPLHGGVERLVRQMLLEAEQDGAEAVVERYRRAGLHLPGFGHAVYRDADPRGVLVHELAAELAPAAGTQRIVEITEAVEQEAARAGVPRPNIDFYTTALYQTLGIPDALSSVVFAVGRLAGWCAHILEQYEHNRLIRPRAAYVGAPSRRWRDVPRG